MCHAQHRTASLLTVCLTLLFCCTVLALAPSADAAETTSPDDGLVLLSDGTGPSVSRPQRDCTGLLAERQSLIQAVQNISILAQISRSRFQRRLHLLSGS